MVFFFTEEKGKLIKCSINSLLLQTSINEQYESVNLAKDLTQFTKLVLLVFVHVTSREIWHALKGGFKYAFI